MYRPYMLVPAGLCTDYGRKAKQCDFLARPHAMLCEPCSEIRETASTMSRLVPIMAVLFIFGAFSKAKG